MSTPDKDERERRAEERAAQYRSGVTRADVAALAVLVGDLGANVRELHDLILDSMVKSETALTTAEAAPRQEDLERERDAALAQGRKERITALLRVYVLLGVTVALMLVIVIIGIAFVVRTHTYQHGQYLTCKERSDQLSFAAEQNQRSAKFFADLTAVERRAAARGDQTAKELLVLFARQPPPQEVPKPADCSRLNPDR